MRQLNYSDTPYRERIEYHSAEFPVYIRRAQMASYPNPRLGHPCHYHEDIEFLYTVRGHLTYSVNGKLVRIGEGEGIFVNSGHLHYGFAEDGTNCEFVCFLINPVLLSVLPYIEREYIRPLMENTSFPYRQLSPDIPWQREILDLLRRAYVVYQRLDQGFALELQSCFYGIWNRLYRGMPRIDDISDKNADNKLNILRKMITFLQSNLREKLTLSEIAAAGHVSESSCCRLFQKYLNRSPIAYLNECRLNEACTLLRDTDLSVTEIAGQTGFNGASYFTEQFRKQYSCTPSSYREATRKRQGAI